MNTTKSDTAPPRTPGDSRRAASVRTAMILASVALVFFGGIIYAHVSGEPTVGMSVLGFGVIGFLIVAIGRNLRR